MMGPIPNMMFLLVIFISVDQTFSTVALNFETLSAKDYYFSSRSMSKWKNLHLFVSLYLLRCKDFLKKECAKILWGSLHLLFSLLLPPKKVFCKKLTTIAWVPTSNDCLTKPESNISIFENFTRKKITCKSILEIFMNIAGNQLIWNFW